MGQPIPQLFLLHAVAKVSEKSGFGPLLQAEAAERNSKKAPHVGVASSWIDL